MNNDKGWVSAHAYGATVTQTVFNGFQTANRTRQAEQIVSAARETLRLTEQSTLLNAVTAYMNLIRDTAILDLQRSNVTVLEEQLRQTRERYKFKEVTLTDIAQSEARLAQARSQLLAAESNYISSRATYKQVIGSDPGRLTAASPVDRLNPISLRKGISLARAQHPSITNAMFNIDAALFQVKIAEGALYPTMNIFGSTQKSINSTTSLFVTGSFSASIAGQVSVPIYQGGGEYAAIRQAKEILQQRRIDLDSARDQVQQTIEQVWGQQEAAKAQIIAASAQVDAAEIALNGVREEARLGQRTVLDVLNAQQELVNARITLVTAQRDRIVLSYSLLAASGNLSAQTLGLQTEIYDPRIHYHQVRDSWAGVRTPSGN